MPDRDERALLAARLRVVDALLAAAERRDEVLEAVSAAGDPAQARRLVCELLDVGPDAAGAVVEMRLARLTRIELGRLAAEAASLRARLG